ncbi:HNH endonuclease signature motif containing protein [Spirillospora sp. NBC_01491]|uniref:HNH endonuclease signature motif containing protein n=1 Tax=Spirillospora sp. NBC_01491 TaxID=2976007 RepID=UPI002E36259D|nr:DUF222 domain-containing protein [Spirillospora sp. NBC_01491]
MGMPVQLAEFVEAQSEWDGRGWFPPGPQLAVCLSGDRDRLGGLSDPELLEVAAAARRQTAWAQARELAAIAELAHRRERAERDGDPDYRVLSAFESTTEEVAAALTVTGNAAATLMHLSGRLSTDLPGTRRALETGRIDLSKARVICDLTDRMPDGVAGRVEQAVLDGASDQTTGQLRRKVNRIVERLAPAAVEDRRASTVKNRRLEVWETPSGTSNLALLDLAATDAHAIYNKISAAAHGLKGDGDSRPLNQIRADLAKELLHGAPLPDAVRTLLAQAGQPADGGETCDAPTRRMPSNHRSEGAAQPDLGAPAAPAGVPALVGDGDGLRGEAGVIEALAALIDGRLTAVAERARRAGRLDALPLHTARALDEMTGRIAELRDAVCPGSGPDRHGHPGHRPPAAVRREVEARHATCVFPTCNNPSGRCDLDHTVPWRPGVTCACNLALLCRRHHRTKQTPGWRLTQPWPGLLVWLTPSGRWHITLPDRR